MNGKNVNNDKRLEYIIYIIINCVNPIRNIKIKQGVLISRLARECEFFHF